MLSIDCHHAQKTSKLPCLRLFRPDTQILSALREGVQKESIYFRK